MIEQIINWYSNPENHPFFLLLLVIIPPLFIMIYCEIFEIAKQHINNKRKTTTQKYREGLIKK